MKSLLALVLLVALTVPGCVPCQEGNGCRKVGRVCHIGNWNKCCCPFSCMGKFFGACLKPTEFFFANMTYTIKDANDTQLLHETVGLDNKAVVTQEHLQTLVARFGDQPLFIDAEIHYSGEENPFSYSVRDYKLL